MTNDPIKLLVLPTAVGASYAFLINFAIEVTIRKSLFIEIPLFLVTLFIVLIFILWMHLQTKNPYSDRDLNIFALMFFLYLLAASWSLIYLVLDLIGWLGCVSLFFKMILCLIL